MSFRQKRYFENSQGQIKYFSDRLFNREELWLKKHFLFLVHLLQLGIWDSGFRI